MKLAELVSHVVGVDTHAGTHTASVLEAATTGVCCTETIPVSVAGYEALVELADVYGDASERAWAIEGTGSYGAGLAAFLAGLGEWVIEIDRPSSPAKRNGAKDDELDSVRAAREALSRDQWAQPRARGEREAMRILLTTRDGAVRDRTRAINRLKAAITTAPQDLRDKIGAASGDVVAVCARLHKPAHADVEMTATIDALHRLARRVKNLEREIDGHERDLKALTATYCPQLLGETGVGPISAAQFYVSWSHPGRCQDEAAFASLAGACPIPASSGEKIRYRLNRGGDRQLNRALHTVVLTRSRCDEATQAYIRRRQQHDNKSARDARRCLKRYVARHIYKLLEAGPTGPPTRP